MFSPGFHTQLLLPSSDSATSRACGAAERGGPPGRGAGQSWTSTNNQRPQLPSSGAHAYRASQLTRASHASCSHLAAISQSCARVHTAGQHALCILHPRHARTPRDGWQHCRAAAMPSQTPRAAPHRRRILQSDNRVSAAALSMRSQCLSHRRKLELSAEALQPSSTTTSGSTPAIAGVAVRQISRARRAAWPLQDGAWCCMCALSRPSAVHPRLPARVPCIPRTLAIPRWLCRVHAAGSRCSGGSSPNFANERSRRRSRAATHP